MSNQRKEYISPYIPSGNPEDYDVATLFRTGELGAAFYPGSGVREYQIVQLDSGATSATPSGVVAVGQPAFWKDRVNKIVTNDQRFSSTARNGVAGMFVDVNTAGYYCAIQVHGPTTSTAPALTTGAFVIGSAAIPSAAGTATVTAEALGTAPTYQPLGCALAVDSGGTVSMYIDAPKVW